MNIQDVLAAHTWRPIGEQNPKIKQVRAILSNTKPNPHKLFAAEGIWILSLCEKFHTPLDSLILCPEHIRTPEAAALADKLAARTEERYTVSAKAFEKISERGQPDGMFAPARLPAHDLAARKGGVLRLLSGKEIHNVHFPPPLTPSAGCRWCSATSSRPPSCRRSWRRACRPGCASWPPG